MKARKIRTEVLTMILMLLLCLLFSFMKWENAQSPFASPVFYLRALREAVPGHFSKPEVITGSVVQTEWTQMKSQGGCHSDNPGSFLEAIHSVL